MPEAYRQRFRNLKKTSNQTYVDFAREKEVLFNRWCMACKADSLSSVHELMLVDEFKNCVPERTVVYLNEQKVTSLQQAATLADEFVLTHRNVFPRREPLHSDSQQKVSDTQPIVGNVPRLSPTVERQCIYCHKTGHLIADCAA